MLVSVVLQFFLNINNYACLGQIVKIDVSMELGGHAGYDYDVCECACKHACILACMLTNFWRA